MKRIFVEITTWIVVGFLLVSSGVFVFELFYGSWVVGNGIYAAHHAPPSGGCQFGSVPGNSGECKRGPDFFSEDSATSTSFTLSPGQLVTLAPSSTGWKTGWNITSVRFSEPCYEIHLDGSVTIFWEECKTIDIRGSSTFGASPTLQAWKGYGDDMANIIAEKNQQLNACIVTQKQVWSDAFSAGAQWDEKYAREQSQPRASTTYDDDLVWYCGADGFKTLPNTLTPADTGFFNCVLTTSIP